jgi:hypothetical protein
MMTFVASVPIGGSEGQNRSRRHAQDSVGKSQQNSHDAIRNRSNAKARPTANASGQLWSAGKVFCTGMHIYETSITKSGPWWRSV